MPLHHKTTDEPVLLAGPGPKVIAEAAQLTGLDGVQVLRYIVGGLLVKKGVDWTAPILAEYLGLFDNSLGTFVLAWDKLTRRFISHGAVFQSAEYPDVGLVAHIRTDDDFKGLGLGTRVTECVLQVGFANGAKVIVLATDDKLLRVQAGERAANRMYSKIGFAVIAERKLADTVDWLMAINPEIFSETTRYQGTHDGKLPQVAPETVARLQAGLVASMLTGYVKPQPQLRIQRVTNGDLAALFLLFNICPPEDFKLKLTAWNIQIGPELEREFVVSLRPAIEDRDRIEDASLILRDGGGRIVAVCAAKQETPFTRQTYRLDFYCLPEFLRNHTTTLWNFVEQTIAGLPCPTRLAFWGVDAEKIAVFERLGFVRTSGRLRLVAPQTGAAFEAQEFVRTLNRYET